MGNTAFAPASKAPDAGPEKLPAPHIDQLLGLEPPNIQRDPLKPPPCDAPLYRMLEQPLEPQTPLKMLSAREISRSIKDLDDDRFGVRAQAERRLAQAPEATAALRRTVAECESPEQALRAMRSLCAIYRENLRPMEQFSGQQSFQDLLAALSRPVERGAALNAMDHIDLLAPHIAFWSALPAKLKEWGIDPNGEFARELRLDFGHSLALAEPDVLKIMERELPKHIDAVKSRVSNPSELEPALIKEFGYDRREPTPAPPHLGE